MGCSCARPQVARPSPAAVSKSEEQRGDNEDNPEFCQPLSPLNDIPPAEEEPDPDTRLRYDFFAYVRIDPEMAKQCPSMPAMIGGLSCVILSLALISSMIIVVLCLSDDGKASAVASSSTTTTTRTLTTLLNSTSTTVEMMLVEESTEETGSTTTATTKPPAATVANTTTTTEQAASARSVRLPCSSGTENCLHSQCCVEAGRRCYAKNSYWAACMGSCSKARLQALDPSHGEWSCRPLGERTRCARRDEPCMDKPCCGAGTHCYEKNQYWAVCLTGCAPSTMQAQDKKHEAWSCLLRQDKSHLFSELRVPVVSDGGHTKNDPDPMQPCAGNATGCNVTVVV